MRKKKLREGEMQRGRHNRKILEVNYETQAKLLTHFASPRSLLSSKAHGSQLYTS